MMITPLENDYSLTCMRAHAQNFLYGELHLED